MDRCGLCPRHCALSAGRFCKKSEKSARISKAFLHKWEEPCISGKNGTGTVFFSGCNLSCVYCQNFPVSHKNVGWDVNATELRNVFLSLINDGAHSIELVTPTHYSNVIAKALVPKLPVPVIYNCGGYESVRALSTLDGLIDVYLPDMKYAFSEISMRLSSAADYPEINLTAVEEMYRQVGDCRFNGDGLLEKGVLVRHLVLPGEIINSKAVIKRFAEISRGRCMLFSLMSQYTPIKEAALLNFKNLTRPLSQNEYRSCLKYLEKYPHIQGYTQELCSSDDVFIPDFE